MQIEAARKLLFSRADPDLLWVRHSMTVCRVARVIGGLLPSSLGLDEEFLACSALLHDIGRCVTHGVWHPWEGWRILSGLGEEKVGRATITHWRKGRSLRRFRRTAASLDWERVVDIFQQVPVRPQTLVDQVVSVSDGMVVHDQVFPMVDRYRDLRERYGQSPWLDDSLRISRGQFGRLSRLAGLDLEREVLLRLAP